MTTKRAIWKGTICFESVEVPVKLYSAIEEKRVHFRLLHRKDHSPVKQRMINSETGKAVAYEDIVKAFTTDDGNLVLLSKDELASLSPASSREIRIASFLPPQTLDHRWYERPYYLGPDNSTALYSTLTATLAATHLEGLAHWTMHGQNYRGLLRLHQGYPLLISLHDAEEVVPVEELPTPAGAAPDKKEIALAKQLMEMLAAPFEPDSYQDDYREAILKLIAIKRKGGKIKAIPKRKKAATSDLSDALSASLNQLKKSA